MRSHPQRRGGGAADVVVRLSSWLSSVSAGFPDELSFLLEQMRRAVDDLARGLCPVDDEQDDRARGPPRARRAAARLIALGDLAHAFGALGDEERRRLRALCDDVAASVDGEG